MFIPPGEYVKYVTHVIYLEGRGVPKVDVEELGTWGVKAVKVEGQSLVGKKGVYYEVERLKKALEGVIEGRL